MTLQLQNMENMKFPSDAQHRTLNYVEVVYLKNGAFESRKFAHYPEDEAAKMYARTINKLTQENRPSLVQLRTESHQLIKSDKVLADLNLIIHQR